MTHIYQSSSDRLQFEILLNLLTESSVNLAVLSDHETTLDYYGTLFEERLRAKGERYIQWCSSSNSEDWVRQFNDILVEITLEQVLEKDTKHASRCFLLLRDSNLLSDIEFQWFARLVNGFPADKLCVIALFNSTGQYMRKVDAFGRNLLKWRVGFEAENAKQALTDAVVIESLAEPVLMTSTFLSQIPTLTQEVEKGEPLFVVNADVLKRSPSRSYVAWALLVALISITALGLMYQDLVLQEVQALKKYLLRGTSDTVADVVSANASEGTELAASAAAHVSSEADQFASTSSASASSVIAAPAEIVASEPQVTASTTVFPKKSDVPLSDAEWISQLPVDSYVVQLAAMDTQEEILSFQRSSTLYANARILRGRQKSTGKRYFILVAGPFESKAQADAFIHSNPLLKKAWLRSSKSMQSHAMKS